MPRRPRIHLAGGIYHAILRGNHRHPIFYQNADRTQLDEIVAHAAAADGVRIHAYCWMPNHIHLAVQVGERPLGHFMQRVASQYARRVQQRLLTTGHLFERRHRAILVQDTSYLGKRARCRSFAYLLIAVKNYWNKKKIGDSFGLRLCAHALATLRRMTVASHVTCCYPL